MKRCSKLILIVIATSFSMVLNAKILSNFSLLSSFSARSSEANDFDYEIALEFEKPDLIYLEIEKERENGETYYNHSIKLMHRWSYVVANAKWLDIRSSNIDVKQIDVRGRYSNYNMGIAQQWNNDIPDTKLVIGVDYYKRLYVFNINFEQDFLSKDLSNWNYETIGKVDLDIYFFNIFWKTEIKDYGQNDWQTKFGIGVKL